MRRKGQNGREAETKREAPRDKREGEEGHIRRHHLVAVEELDVRDCLVVALELVHGHAQLPQIVIVDVVVRGAERDVVALLRVEAHAADVGLALDGVHRLAPLLLDRPDLDCAGGNGGPC